MEIHEQRHGAVTVVKPAGAIAGDDAEQLRERALALAASSLGRLTLDLAAAPFADSRGLEVLVEIADELSQRGQSLKVCGLSDNLREVLDLTGLSPQFEFFADATDAVRSFL